MTTGGSSREYVYSIILGGKVGVGKTSLYHRIVHDSFSEEPRSPSGLYEGGLERGVYRLRVDGDEVEANLWDTGGLERYTAMTANYFRNCHAVILVFSVEEENTLFVLRDWLSEAQALNSDHVVPALWGNKSDSYNKCVTEEMVCAFGKENTISADLVTTVSAQTGHGVKEAFERLIRMIHARHRGEQCRTRTLEPLIDPKLHHKTSKHCAC